MFKLITLDGPAGVGKGTICKLLSKHLDAIVLNSGEIFRTIAFNLKINKINLDDISSVIDYTKNFNYEKIASSKLYSKDIDLASSKISSIPSLRKITVKIQRDFVKLNSRFISTIVAEGRDMGTVIFPKADIKIFMWAKAEVRAERRMIQIDKSQKTREFNIILNEITLRDRRDMRRKIAPLRPAEDSYLIDNSNLDIEQCFNKILKIIKKLKTNK